MHPPQPGFLVQRTTTALTENTAFGINSLVGKELARRSPSMPGDPRECRQHALTCVRLAQTSASSQAREQFANLAQTWIRLADDLERSLLERSLAFLDALEDETEPAEAKPGRRAA